MHDQVRIRIINSLPEIEEIRACWASWDGHRDSDIDLYLHILRSTPEVVRPHIFVLYRDGHPAALFIGRVEERRVQFAVGYLKLFKPHVRMLVFANGALRGQASRENAQLFVAQIMHSLRQREADMAVLERVENNSPLFDYARRLPGFLARDHVPVITPHRTMRLPRSLEEVYRGLSRHHRKHVRREAKQFRNQFSDLRIRCLRETTELDVAIRDIEETAKKTYQRGLGVGFANTSALRQRLHLEAEKGWLRAYILYVGDQPCAFSVGTVYHNTFYSNFLGHDPVYAKYSPGTFLFMRMIEDFCNENVRGVDFGFGDALYKQRFGNSVRNEARVHIYARTVKGFQLNLLRTVTALADRLAKKALEKTGLLPRIKRLWRNRVARGTFANGLTLEK